MRAKVVTVATPTRSIHHEGHDVRHRLGEKMFSQIHGVEECGKATLKRPLKRAKVAEFFATLPLSVIGMEACGSAHHWARKLQNFGHTVRLMAPQFIKPYVKTNKSDAEDAQDICEAVARSNMRFVPIKNVEKQAVLAWNRARQGFVKAHTSQAKKIVDCWQSLGWVFDDAAKWASQTA
jgi:transposase